MIFLQKETANNQDKRTQYLKWMCLVIYKLMMKAQKVRMLLDDCFFKAQHFGCDYRRELNQRTNTYIAFCSIVDYSVGITVLHSV